MSPASRALVTLASPPPRPSGPQTFILPPPAGAKTEAALKTRGPGEAAAAEEDGADKGKGQKMFINVVQVCVWGG